MNSSTSQAEMMERFCEQTGEAHAALLHATHDLEVSLIATPRSADPQKWRMQADQQVGSLIDCLKVHCVQTEGYGGLVREMEFMQGHSEYLTRLQESYQRVMNAANSLLQHLESPKLVRSPSSWLRQLGYFSVAVHEHEACEIDVIYETFWRDPVGGD